MPCTACSGSPHNATHSASIYIYILLLCVVRRAAYPKLIQFNARNIYKIRIVQCSIMESYSNSSARVPESSGNREDRLQRRRERERAHRASETAEQREERLRVRRTRDRARRAAQTAEERDARLRQIRDNRRQSLASESEEERAARQQQMSANQHHRLAAETGSERGANVDMQYCLSRHRVVEYCAKYATKCEPRSQPLKEVFTNIVRSLKDDNTSLKAVQKLLINSVGERDYSAQETCHLLLQLPMFRASRDFIMLSLDGSRAVGDRLDEDQPATALSALDHYIGRPTTPQFNEMTLLHYVQQFAMPKQLGSNPFRRRKAVVVIVRPYFSRDPSGPNYEEHCRQKLIRPHQPRRTSAPYQPHRTSRSSRACAAIAFELTLAPTMQCIHLVNSNVLFTPPSLSP